MNDLVTDNDNEFRNKASESLKSAKKLEEEHQISFENYLEEFLNKIS